MFNLMGGWFYDLLSLVEFCAHIKKLTIAENGVVLLRCYGDVPAAQAIALYGPQEKRLFR